MPKRGTLARGKDEGAQGITANWRASPGNRRGLVRQNSTITNERREELLRRARIWRRRAILSSVGRKAIAQLLDLIEGKRPPPCLEFVIGDRWLETEEPAGPFSATKA